MRSRSTTPIETCDPACTFVHVCCPVTSVNIRCSSSSTRVLRFGADVRRAVRVDGGDEALLRFHQFLHLVCQLGHV